MTKEDILEYVAKTPHNTNPNMIGNMIDALGSGGTEPSGTMQIIENGTYDVTEYASAAVSVPSFVSFPRTLTVKATIINGPEGTEPESTDFLNVIARVAGSTGTVSWSRTQLEYGVGTTTEVESMIEIMGMDPVARDTIMVGPLGDGAITDNLVITTGGSLVGPIFMDTEGSTGSETAMIAINPDADVLEFTAYVGVEPPTPE